ncbi:hypothetical protein [Thioalkalivibrio sp. ALJ7]|uniref:hypothetical protein n=1 Tax=Thioalkalivibrio sp. ALJ7 TaxID=1158756 RepID=UPI00047795DB|nr:hypothetical protein [Thioalkalivibrio sp. ALJ7]
MLAGLVLMTGSAIAADTNENPVDPGSSSLLPMQTLTAVDTETLNLQRARQGVSNVQLGQVHSQIALHDNVVLGGHGGTNLIANGAFDNARGFSTVIQNTGHNVAIQESMIVNVTINP